METRSRGYIQLKFQLGLEEYLKFRYTSIYGKKWFIIVTVAAFIYFIFLCTRASTYFTNFKVDINTGLFLMQFIIVAYLLFGLPLSLYAKSKKMAAFAPAMNADHTYSISKEAIARRGPDKSTKLTWEDVIKVQEYSDLYALNVSKTLVMLLPKRAFEEGDEEYFKDILKEKVASSNLKLLGEDIRLK